VIVQPTQPPVTAAPTAAPSCPVGTYGAGCGLVEPCTAFMTASFDATGVVEVPCRNNGVCEQVTEPPLDRFTCRCDAFHAGDRCELSSTDAPTHSSPTAAPQPDVSDDFCPMPAGTTFE